MARSIQEWLDAYGESHQNKVNKAFHWVCVPIITWSLIAILWSIPLPGFVDSESFFANYGFVFIILSLLFYMRLSLSLTIGMLLFSAGCLWLIWLHLEFVGMALWLTAIVLFVLAWIGQFIGHKVEGKKPSFFEDLQFLMIGPVWLLSDVYRRMGISIK